jgi:hypothetical protein
MTLQARGAAGSRCIVWGMTGVSGRSMDGSLVYWCPVEGFGWRPGPRAGATLERGLIALYPSILKSRVLALMRCIKAIGKCDVAST